MKFHIDIKEDISYHNDAVGQTNEQWDQTQSNALL